MGDQLEIFFGRDSGEGLQRLIFGVKPKEEAHQIRGKRIEFRVTAPEMFRGAYARLVYDEATDQVTIGLMPQVAFRHPADDSWVFLRDFELTAESVAPYRRFTESRLFGSTDDMARVQARLDELGVQTGDGFWIANPEWPSGVADIEVTYSIDQIITRTVAKIAFNYLAYVTSDRPHFVLHASFDHIRRFIRFGEATHWSVVRGMNTKILEGDTQRLRTTLGHVLTADWRPEGSVVAEVSLFNDISYRVYLTKDPPGRVWWDLMSGHVFDIESRTITPVSAARRILIERP
jgi:hypothetical protein